MRSSSLCSVVFFVALSSADAVLAQTKAGASKTSTTSKTASAKPTRLHYTVAAVGNEARYRVREQLAGFDLPNDAVGVTKDVAGRLVVDADGKIVRDSSKIVVQVTSLKSDKARRDGYIRRATLQTATFPQVELVPVSFDGINAPLPASGSKTFSLVGDLTVHGVTRPTTWQVTAHADGNDIVGTATTAFTFKDFELAQPHVPVVLSVADTIKLEYDFRFAPEYEKP
ncbi:MAG TPA: YceI family protein [Acidimicrobiia bacterium]|nr:YceI family protein [Acidimicrobiia bacterium]